ncbi:hypothetical protein JP34_11895 [Gallibacterium anatis]|uniref:hypothetical protein n=1 Tax=Gallibacterium anatis TaxID=750 RepID=UPI000531CC1F|nr:hypothetical protein [Gallibacterium anatis]KGQ30148.1 hypothetical protein JP34_11895 [Gallibacterium anatis]
MKVFIYGFVSVYVGLLSKSIFIFLFDKYINHIAGNVDFFAPVKTSIVAAIILYFVRVIFHKND